MSMPLSAAEIVIDSPTNGAVVTSPVMIEARVIGMNATEINCQVNMEVTSSISNANKAKCPADLTPGVYEARVCAGNGRMALCGETVRFEVK